MNRLKLLRNEQGLTQADVARHLNLTSQAYNYLENGKRKLTQEYLKILSKLYNVSIDYILGSSDSRVSSDTLLEDSMLKIGLDMKNYNPPTAEQKKQIEEFAKYVLKDNKKE